MGKIKRWISAAISLVMVFTFTVAPVSAAENTASSGVITEYHSEISSYGYSNIMLTENAAQARDALASAMLAGKEYVDVSAYDLTVPQLKTLFNIVIPSDYPQAMETDTYTYAMNRVTERVMYVRFTYDGTQEEILAHGRMVDEIVNALVARIDMTMSDLQKVKLVHDYLVQTVAYDEEALNEETSSRISFSPYGALVEGKAVCQGYALAFQLFMNRLNINSIFVSSEAMNHAWNMVQIDGEWYHVDATWDDPVPDVPGRIYYNAFMVSDARIRDAENRHYRWDTTAPLASNRQYDSFDWSVMETSFEGDISELKLDTQTVSGTAGSQYQFIASMNSQSIVQTVVSSNPEVATVTLTNANDPRGWLYTVNLVLPGEATILVTTPQGGLQMIDIQVQEAAALANAA